MSELGERVVIVGAGHAGGSAAAFLRQFGWSGPITVIGEEPLPPYQRPPLSKAWLKGEASADDLMLRGDDYWAGERIELRLGARVQCIDIPGKRILTIQGGEVGYDRLILATGARPRKIALPGADLKGVLELRSAADAEALKQALGPGKRLAVIGGGYIGLEAAASARSLGAEVVLIEREPRVLARVACPSLSTFFFDLHRRHGVAFLLGAELAEIEGEHGRVTGLRLSTGDSIACDAVLVGVGAVPNDELARAAGLACENGVVVDLSARTSDPSISAIGDCTRRPLPLYRAMGRLESVPNALEQARQAASDLCGRPAPAGEAPWFWSDQYDIKLQIAGLPLLAELTVVRGEPAAGRFSVFHLTADGRVQCVEAVNSPADFMGGRQLLMSRQQVAAHRLRDSAIPMKLVAS